MKTKQLVVIAVMALAASVMITSCGSEAKTFAKEGWKVAPGAASIEEQLAKSKQMRNEQDAEGLPKYLIGNAMSIGEMYDAAKMQANELASIAVAGQLEKVIMTEVDNIVANEQLPKEEAASVAQTVMANKNIIAQRLGRTIPIIEMYRTLSNKNVQVNIFLAYNSKTATEAAKEAVKAIVRDDLKNKGKEMSKNLNKMIDR